MSEERAGPLRHPVVVASLAVGLALAALVGGRDAPVAEPDDEAQPHPTAPFVAELGHETTIGGVAYREPAVTPRPAAYPDRSARERARRFAEGRSGEVSFALIDSRGHAFGWNERRRYVSASIVKAPLMVAELRRQANEKPRAVDGGTAALLRAMVTYSDNSSADVIYLRGRDEALYDVAQRTGMRRFTVAGHWGNAQVTAADMARFMSRIDDAVPRRHRPMAHELLGGVVEDQRWGIPAAAEPRWRTELKGGWRSTDAGELVHQAARLERGKRKLSIAVLTDGQPSQAYGRETVQGVAERLLAAPVSGPDASASKPGS